MEVAGGDGVAATETEEVAPARAAIERLEWAPLADASQPHSPPIPAGRAAWIRWRRDHAAAISATHRAFLAQQSRAQQEALSVQAPLLQGVQRLARPGGSGLERRATVQPALTNGAVVAAPPPASPSTPQGDRTSAPLPPAAVHAPAPPLASPAVHASAPPAPPAPLVHAPAPPAPPLFSRAQLERLASGKISEVFGPMFRAQDGYPRQVRMPMPNFEGVCKSQKDF
jgi:hypothetical protein